MQTKMKKLIGRALIVSTMMLSFQTARAGLIGPDAAAATSAPTERTIVLNALDRAEVVAQLQSYGIDPNAARARVNAMTDQEVHTLAQDIQTAPAGAITGWGWVGVLVVIGLIWYFAMRK